MIDGRIHSNMPEYKDMSLTERKLVIAATKGSVQSVKSILTAHQQEINTKVKYTALHQSIRRGYVNVMECLLKYGADATQCSVDGDNALQIALFRYDKCSDTKRQMVQKLCEHKDMFEQPLFKQAYAGELEHIKDTQFAGQVDSNGYTAIHYACVNGQLEATKALYQQGADLNATSNGRQPLSPLIVSTLNGHIEISRWLISEHAQVSRCL